MRRENGREVETYTRNDNGSYSPTEHTFRLWAARRSERDLTVDENLIAPENPAAGPGPAGVPAPVKRGRKPKAVTAAQTGTVLAAVTPELSGELEARRATYATLLKTVQDVPCETQEVVDWLTATAQRAKAVASDLTDRQKTITDPLKAAMEATKSLFAPALAFLGSVESAAKAKIEAKLQLDSARRDEALRQMAASAGPVDPSTLATATGSEMVSAGAGSYLVDHWTYEITDASQLPAGYWVPNEALLGRCAREQKETANIPGVRVFNKPTLAVRK